MRSLVLILLGIILVGIQILADCDSNESQWKEFKSLYGKTYETEAEEQYRREIFIKNLIMIEEHNKNYAMGLVSYKFGINKFSDLTQEEYLQTLGKLTVSGSEDAPLFVPPDITIPNFIDWRTEGAVTPIKDQGDCGSCWSFSATGALEGQYFRKTGKLVSVSEQNLMDCTPKEVNNGCDGGLPEAAFQYVLDNGGINSEVSYPYEGKGGACRYNPKHSVGPIRNFSRIEVNEDHLKVAVAIVGPISVGISADELSFRNYDGGVLDDRNCSKILTHAVLIVGYGTTDKGKDYWLVKNSWGTSFGEEGYIRMSRNRDNRCGIASQAVFPII